MKYILILLFLITISFSAANAGKWNDPIFLKTESSPYGGYLLQQDSLGNTWFCIEPFLWMTDSLGKTAKRIDKIERVNGEVSYLNFPATNTLPGNICFSGHSIFTSMHDTLVYATKDSIFKIDTAHPVIREVYLPRMYPGKIAYYDSTFYFFLLNQAISPDPTKIPGVFRYSERTRELEWIISTSNFDHVPNMNEYGLYLLDSLIFYPSYNYGLVFYNTNTGEVYHKNLREVIGDSKLNPRNHCYRDGNLYFMSDVATQYKLNLRNMEYTTEDLMDTPIYHDNDTVTNFQVALRYVCDEYKLYSYYNIAYKIMSTTNLYIHFANGDWKRIDPYDVMKQDIDSLFSISGPRVSSDNKKLWFYGRILGGVIDSAGNTCRQFVRSYDMDPGSSIEETETMPTALLTKVYPNPSNRTISIEFFLHPNFRENVTFEIYDYMGRKIKDLDNSYDYSAVEAWGKKTINVESMSTGIYYLVLDNGNEKRSIGFAVE